MEILLGQDPFTGGYVLSIYFSNLGTDSNYDRSVMLKISHWIAQKIYLS